MKKNAIYAMSVGAMLIGFTACNSGTSNTDSVDTANAMNENIQEANATPVSQDDADFGVKAANAGMTEVEASKLALNTSTNANVKKYAQMIIDDHTTAAGKLSTIATAKQITLPASLSEDSQNKIADLGKKTGKDFDKAYIDMMVSDHKDAVDAFQKESDNTKDAELKSFTTETIPVLQKHLAEAKVWQDKM